MDPILTATLTKTFRLEPLAVVEGLPGSGAELTPLQLRALAGALTRIAADCEARPVAHKRCLAERRSYPLQGT